MKKIFFLLLFLFCSLISFSQYVNTTTTGSATTLFKSKGGLTADSSLIISAQIFTDTTSANYSVVSKYSGTLIQVSGGQIWVRQLNPNKWNKFALSSGGGYVLISDTALMLTPYLRKSDTAFMLSTRVKYSDTAYQMSGYVRKGYPVLYTDSANMLSPYLRKTDTANMLVPYVRNNRTITTNAPLFGGGDLSANRTFGIDTGRANAQIPSGGDLNKVRDSLVGLISGGGLGTVLNVSTTGGVGIISSVANPTSTPNISLRVDTIAISTRAWRQKGDDSLGGLIALKVNISDTATMLNPYLRKSDTATMLAPFVQYSDTAAMLSNRLKVSDTATMLSNRLKISDTAYMLSNRLKISDTATMLSGYTRVQRFLDTASTLRTLINTKGTGTVTSVALSLPAMFSVSGSPITTSGTLTASLANQTANRVFAGPTTGSPAQPTFRALVAADLPDSYLPISDTAAMLANRLKISDTSTMLSNYILGNGVNGYITFWNGTRFITGSNLLTFNITNGISSQRDISLSSTNSFKWGNNLTLTGNSTSQAISFGLNGSEKFRMDSSIIFYINNQNIPSDTSVRFNVFGNQNSYRNKPNYQSFMNTTQGGRGLIKTYVGQLGNPEANLSHNMNYETQVHKFDDSTRAASWIALSSTGFFIQYAPPGSNQGDIWANGGLKYWVSSDSLGHWGFNTNSSVPTGDGIIYLNRYNNMPSIVGNDTLVLEGGRLKGGIGNIYLNRYNTGSIFLNNGGGTVRVNPITYSAGSYDFLIRNQTDSSIQKLSTIPNTALTNSTISGVSLGSNLNTLTFGTHLTGTSYNGSAPITIGTDATSSNTSSTIMSRDASGNTIASVFTSQKNGAGFISKRASSTIGSNYFDYQDETGSEMGYTGFSTSSDNNFTIKNLRGNVLIPNTTIVSKLIGNSGADNGVDAIQSGGGSILGNLYRSEGKVQASNATIDATATLWNDNTNGSTVTYTLPSTSSLTGGRFFFIKSGTGTLTLSAYAANKIVLKNGTTASTVSLASTDGLNQYYFDGNLWYQIN